MHVILQIENNYTSPLPLKSPTHKLGKSFQWNYISFRKNYISKKRCWLSKTIFGSLIHKGIAYDRVVRQTVPISWQMWPVLCNNPWCMPRDVFCTSSISITGKYMAKHFSPIFLEIHVSLCNKTMKYLHLEIIYRVRIMVFNATFNNIPVISWRSVLLVEETRVPRENHRPAASYWQTFIT